MVSGTLYVVATPIGNLSDISQRALDVLGAVSLVAAEDTRHSARLLRASGITTPMISLHEHNEEQRCPQLLERLRAGDRIALISDAGTPLISDPGYRLVCAAAAAGLTVSPIPGPSSILAALSVAGLPSDRFVFEGFLPTRASARRKRLSVLASETRTCVVLESAHRILDTLGDLADIFGSERPIAVARELTKLHETVLRGRLADVHRRVEEDPDQRRGEFTLVIGGANAPGDSDAGQTVQVRALLSLLLEELPPARAAGVVARATGLPKREIYALALQLGGT